MATVNLGNIKLNWKGAYNAGTAYVIDDVVSYNGSSYVCIAATTGNLPTVTAKWNQMSAAGTNGTDIGTTITTQGDILYRDGSGLQRLAAGTNGQALLTGGAGANPSWGDVAGGLIQSASTVKTNSQTINYSAGRTVVSQLNVTLGATPSASSKLLIMGNIDWGFNTGDPSASFRWEYSADNSTWYGDKYLGNGTGEGKANWAGSSWRYDSKDHPNFRYLASVNAIIAVNALSATTPRYFRVTMAQTDTTNDDIQIGTGQATGSATYPIATSSFNVIELGA